MVVQAAPVRYTDTGVEAKGKELADTDPRSPGQWACLEESSILRLRTSFDLKHSAARPLWTGQQPWWSRQAQEALTLTHYLQGTVATAPASTRQATIGQRERHVWNALASNSGSSAVTMGIHGVLPLRLRSMQ